MGDYDVQFWIDGSTIKEQKEGYIIVLYDTSGSQKEYADDIKKRNPFMVAKLNQGFSDELFDYLENNRSE